MPGIDGLRCGSLARIGLPVLVSAPESTKEFEPMPVPPSPSRLGSESIDRESADRVDAASRQTEAGRTAALPWVGPGGGCRSKAPLTTPPLGTMGRLRSYG